MSVLELDVRDIGISNGDLRRVPLTTSDIVYDCFSSVIKTVWTLKLVKKRTGVSGRGVEWVPPSV